MGVLIGLSEDAEATIVNVNDPRDMYVYNTNLDDYYFYAGDQNIEFYVAIRNGYSDSLDDDNPIRYLNVTIDPVVHGENGEWVDSPVGEWLTSRVDDEATLYEGNYNYFYGFEFHIRADADPLIYNFTVRMDYKTEDGVRVSSHGYIHWELYPTAIIDNFSGLYPGDINKERSIRLDIRRTISEARLFMDAPSEGFTFFGDSLKATAQRDTQTSSDWYPTFLLTVDNTIDAGTYYGTWRLVYDNYDGVTCTETGEIEYLVNSLPMVEVRSSIQSITQGTTKETMTLFVKNTGNVRLYGVEVAISSHSTDYVWLAPDHYEGSSAVGNRWVTAGETGDIQEGDETSVTIDLTIDEMIPQGTHKIMFDFRGYYYDYWAEAPLPTYGYWTYTSDAGMVPEVEMDTGDVTLHPSYSSVTGMAMILEVEDAEMDVIVSSVSTTTVGPAKKGIEVVFYLQNFGEVDYRAVVVKMETGTTASPFINPTDANADYSDDFKIEGNFYSGSSKRIAINVELDQDVDPGFYQVPIMVTGEEVLRGQAVAATVKVKLQVRGLGPILEIRSVSPESIDAGKDFTLSLTIYNIGDDVATNVILGSYSPETSTLTALLGDEGNELNGDISPPEAMALPMFLGDIAPGAFVMAEIQMRANPDMSDGHVYTMAFMLDYADSFGGHPSGVESIQEVSLKATGDGGSVQASMYDSAATLMWVAAVVLILVVVVYAMSVFLSNRTPGERVPREPKPPKEKKEKAKKPETIADVTTDTTAQETTGQYDYGSGDYSAGQYDYGTTEQTTDTGTQDPSSYYDQQTGWGTEGTETDKQPPQQ